MKPNPSLLCMPYFYTDPRVSDIKPENEQKIITSLKLWKCEVQVRRQAGVLSSALCMYCHSRQKKYHEGHFFKQFILIRFKSVSYWLLQFQRWRYHLCLCTVRAQSASIPQLDTATDHKQEHTIPFRELFRTIWVKFSSMNIMLSQKKDVLLSGISKVLLMHYWTWVISWRKGTVSELHIFTTCSDWAQINCLWINLCSCSLCGWQLSVLYSY